MMKQNHKSAVDVTKIDFSINLEYKDMSSSDEDADHHRPDPNFKIIPQSLIGIKSPQRYY